jgi:hypothetical protein
MALTTRPTGFGPTRMMAVMSCVRNLMKAVRSERQIEHALRKDHSPSTLYPLVPLLPIRRVCWAESRLIGLRRLSKRAVEIVMSFISVFVPVFASCHRGKARDLAIQ